MCAILPSILYVLTHGIMLCLILQEFMIEDNELINKEELPVDYSADYWEKRYCVQRDRVPKFLEKFTDIILRTGKYLNVISQCGE